MNSEPARPMLDWLTSHPVWQSFSENYEQEIKLNELQAERISTFIRKLESANIEQATILAGLPQYYKNTLEITEPSEKVTPITEQAVETGVDKHQTIQFIYSPLAQMFLPHSETGELLFSRSNGMAEIHWVSKNGIPYGVAPRLLFFYIFSMAKKYKIKEVPLGKSMSALMRDIGVTPVSGKKGNVARYTEQLKRLSTSFITLEYQQSADNDMQHLKIQNCKIFKETNLWFDPEYKKSASASVILDDEFYESLMKSAVPLELNAIRALKDSALALDIYTFLTYRSNKSTRRPIPWQGLADQFGSGYDNLKNFKLKFNKQLELVKKVWPECKAETSSAGLHMKDTKPHIESTLR
ncbi:hypothetical protein N480_25410 [Pseudoalteromonas luteoviolacea S2607]|uniref:replication protein RepA n=1 Tax=Pseudoalteromonas luteoviolacea TaxID=43657 RepID=UPI0007B047B1|nr:replication protein RepA [Pseudoalteromonas luteoviolacea]KZN32591.1 hypothetical protein N480_25410 [Pseudoalteromonas luteoviolacea S2607]